MEIQKDRSRVIFWVILTLQVVLASWLFWHFSGDWRTYDFDHRIWIFVAAGFVAQVLDGTIGMAYGICCTSFLLNLGVSPAMASANVHIAEVFTTGVSGISHLKLKNVDKKLFFRILIPGVIGATLGAFLLSKILDGDKVKPFIAAYLLVLGVVILFKAFKRPVFKEEVKSVIPLGFFGGLLDSVGGGGWGSIVTANLIRQGKTPQMTIGTVNTAEFFIAFVSAGVFFYFLGIKAWMVLFGLILGGIFAAPFGAILVRMIKPKVLMLIVAFVIILTSAFTIYTSIL